MGNIQVDLKRLDASLDEDMYFMYKTRFHPDVMKTLVSCDIPKYSEHKAYLEAKKDDSHIFYLIKVGKISTGYCQCLRVEKDTWELGWVINPRYQGQGIGKLAVQRLLEKVKELGARVATLVVLKTNTKAIHIYKSFGFEIYGQKDDFLLMKLGLITFT